MDEWAQVFYGAVGAAAPEVVRLWRIITGRTRESLPRIDPVYFLVAGLFLVLGGIFARALNASNPVAALYIGATFPLILSGWLRSR